MRRCLAAAAALACVAAQAGPRATIELLSQARVTADQVSLGHVAHLSSTDLDLVRRLVNLPLGRAPRAGQPATVERSTLAHWIRRETGLEESDLAWRGAEAARVVRAVRAVRGEEIAAAAVDAARAWLAAQGVHAEVEARMLPRDVEAPAGELRLHARPLEGAQVRKRLLVWVELWSDAAFVRTVPVALDLAGEPTELARTAPLQLEPAPRAVAEHPLVLRGDWATLRSTAGAVTLESRVEVLQDGRAGQRVRVRQPGATGILFARVVGAAQLELAP